MNRTYFIKEVLRITSEIPEGKTLSYKEVARLAGKAKAYRAVGNILSKNFDPAVPCHRVIRSDGKAGGYNRGEKKKIKILVKEKAYK
jgi:O-6-methylguanine DNA methyltransferase